MIAVLGIFATLFVVQPAFSLEKKSTKEAEPARGPHGGKLFGDDDFQVEVTIYEPDIPPQSRVYFYEYGEPLDPDAVKISMELHRIDRVDVFSYRKQDDYAIGDKVVEEPHSFDVKIQAIYKGKTYNWEYASYEGRTELSPKAVESAGLVIESAGPATIRSTLHVTGRIIPNEYELLHLTPRFSGVVKTIKKQLGDTVQANEVIATIESNESLTLYEVRSKIAGTVIQRDVSLGEVVSDGDELFVVANLESVWAEFNIYRSDIQKVKKGQTVIIRNGKDDPSVTEATISYVSPVSSPDTQAFLARAVVPNTSMKWNPGLFILGEVVLDQEHVPVAVKADALQTFRDWDVVFQRKGNLFEIAILELGRRDGEWVEVLSGLEPETEYVTENSFVVKADVLKSGASHDH